MSNEPVTQEAAIRCLREWMQASVEIRKSMRPEGVKRAYSCMEDFVLQRGKIYAPVPLTAGETKVVRAAAREWKNNFPIKQCFGNSQMLVLTDSTGLLKYVEGMALGVIPVLHGWVTINNKVVDLTLRTYEEDVYKRPRTPFRDRVLGDFPPRRAYWGAEFTYKEVVSMTLAKDCYSSFLDDWQNDWPLLRTGKLA